MFVKLSGTVYFLRGYVFVVSSMTISNFGLQAYRVESIKSSE
jgi:hypothetical protein